MGQYDVPINFVKAILTGGIADTGEGIKKWQKGGSFFDFVDRAVDPGGTLDAGTRWFGEQLPPEARESATTLGSLVGNYWGPGGAAAGAGIGSKIAGDSSQEGFKKAGLAAIASYLFGGKSSSGGTEEAVSGVSLGAKDAGELAATEGTKAAALSSSESTVDSLLNNKLLIKYVTGLGSDLMKYGAAPNQGMQFTNVNNVTNQQIQSQQFMKLMAQLLSSDDSSGKFDKKGITINTGTDSSLYRGFMGEPFEAKSELAPKDKESFFSNTKLSNLNTPLDDEGIDKVRQNSMFSNAANPFSSL